MKHMFLSRLARGPCPPHAIAVRVPDTSHVLVCVTLVQSMQPVIDLSTEDNANSESNLRIASHEANSARASRVLLIQASSLWAQVMQPMHWFFPT